MLFSPHTHPSRKVLFFFSTYRDLRDLLKFIKSHLPRWWSLHLNPDLLTSAPTSLTTKLYWLHVTVHEGEKMAFFLSCHEMVSEHKLIGTTMCYSNKRWWLLRREGWKSRKRKNSRSYERGRRGRKRRKDMPRSIVHWTFTGIHWNNNSKWVWAIWKVVISWAG